MTVPEGTKMVAETRAFCNLKIGDILFVANGLHVVRSNPERDDIGRLTVKLDGSNSYSSERDDQAILVWKPAGFMEGLGF